MVEVKRILFPTDFSPCAESAMEYAGDLANHYQAELVLLHVVYDPSLEVPEFGMGLAFPGFIEEIPKHRREAMSAAKESLIKLSDRLPAGLVSVEYHVQFGQPFLEILKFSNEHSIDLIVVGTHGRTGLSHVLLGSVAERVIQKANCPVLTVRSKSAN